VAASVPVSGLFDLRPLVRTSVNRELGLDERAAAAVSPACAAGTGSAPTLLVVGGGETDGFRWQSERYEAVLAAAGVPVEREEAPGLDHFTILEALADPAHPLLERTLRFVLEHLETTR
jgi:arylformamidase